MARKTLIYTVEAEGRDKGKQFFLTEMSATKAEDWAIRVMLALGAANVELPDGLLDMGMAGLAEVGLKKLFALSPDTVRPLLAELMECAQFQPDRKHPEVRRAVIENDVEEARTLMTLKWEVLKLHLDFSLAADPSAFLGGSGKVSQGPQQHTETSHESSVS